jgi:hypothetical protein
MKIAGTVVRNGEKVLERELDRLVIDRVTEPGLQDMPANSVAGPWLIFSRRSTE